MSRSTRLVSLTLALLAWPALAGAAAAQSAPPACPPDAHGLCGAPGHGQQGALEHAGERAPWDTDAYRYGEQVWTDAAPAAWEDDFDNREYLARHAGWNRPAEHANRSVGVPGRVVSKPTPSLERGASYQLEERLIGNNYVVVRSPRAYGLNPAPRGHYYVRTDGEFLLVESGTQRIRARLSSVG
ncbi:RcnB family protein [Maricaulis sp. CAU 1757]